MIVAWWVLFVSTASSVHADDIQHLAREYAQVTALIADRRFAEAEPRAKKLLEFCESRFLNDPAARVMCHTVLANIYLRS
jgi:hypothetical protein